MFLTFELRVCPRKQVLRFIVNDHFFSHPIFRPTYMMLQVWEAGDQRESDGVVTALQARCGRTLDHQWGAKSCCGGSTKTSFKARSVRACYMLVGVPADVTKLLASCDAVGMPARQTLRAYISNLAKYPQVTSSSFILLFCSKPFWNHGVKEVKYQSINCQGLWRPGVRGYLVLSQGCSCW